MRFKYSHKLAIALTLTLIFVSVSAFWLAGEENGCSFGPRWKTLWASPYSHSPDPPTPKPPPRFAPQWTPDGAHIVFSDLRGKYDNPSGVSGCIYAVKSDGSAFLWERGGVEGVSPDISPDGSLIVYETLYHGLGGWAKWTTDSVGTLQLDNSEKRLLLADGDIIPEWSPRLSPDGSRIAFLRYTESRYIDILTMADDGSDRRLVLAHDSLDWPHETYRDSTDIIPVWSPDGQTLAFAVNEVEAYDSARYYRRLYRDIYSLYTVGADGEELTRIFQANVDDHAQSVVSAPVWSPDGEKLAFSFMDLEGMRDSIGKQYVINRDGSGLRKIGQITYPTYYEPNVVMDWSPNGDKIVVSSAQPIDLYDPSNQYLKVYMDEFTVPHGIFIAKSDGSGVTWIAKGSNASWSPDGSRIAILSNRGIDLELGERLGVFGQALSTIAPDGSDYCVVAMAAGSSRDPLWIAANSPPSLLEKVWYALNPFAGEPETRLC